MKQVQLMIAGIVFVLRLAAHLRNACCSRPAEDATHESL